MSTATELWEASADSLKHEVSDAIWQAYLAGLRPVDISDDTLELSVPNGLIRERVEHRFLGLIQDVVSAAYGQPCKIALTVADAPERARVVEPLVDASDDDLPPQFQVPSAAARPPAADRTGGSTSTPLNPGFTFETFVVAATNRFSHAAAMAVAEAPGRSYNPLVIYGDAGLGKTHLLHAIGNYVRETDPKATIRYMSTESFLNEFVDALRTDTMPNFKRRFRECDVLLVDDIQFMQRREGTQEEFFHTFNSLHERSKQIVLTSDRPPKDISALEDRLLSRFMSGVMTEVQPPDHETRLAILRAKTERDGLEVPGEVLEFIATQVTDNIRVLEGALIRVAAYSSLNSVPLTLDVATQVLADLVQTSEPRQITPQMILDATAEVFGFSVEEIIGPNRRRPLVTARQCSIYVFRELTDYSYPAIAKVFGGRDHATIIHSVNKIAAQMSEKRQIFNQVQELLQRLKTEP